MNYTKLQTINTEQSLPETRHYLTDQQVIEAYCLEHCESYQPDYPEDSMSYTQHTDPHRNEYPAEYRAAIELYTAIQASRHN